MLVQSCFVWKRDFLSGNLNFGDRWWAEFHTYISSYALDGQDLWHLLKLRHPRLLLQRWYRLAHSSRGNQLHVAKCKTTLGLYLGGCCFCYKNILLLEDSAAYSCTFSGCLYTYFAALCIIISYTRMPCVHIHCYRRSHTCTAHVYVLWGSCSMHLPAVPCHAMCHINFVCMRMLFYRYYY